MRLVVALIPTICVTPAERSISSAPRTHHRAAIGAGNLKKNNENLSVALLTFYNNK